MAARGAAMKRERQDPRSPRCVRSDEQKSVAAGGRRPEGIGLCRVVLGVPFRARAAHVVLLRSIGVDEVSQRAHQGRKILGEPIVQVLGTRSQKRARAYHGALLACAGSTRGPSLCCGPSVSGSPQCPPALLKSGMNLPIVAPIGRHDCRTFRDRSACAMRSRDAGTRRTHALPILAGLVRSAIPRHSAPTGAQS